MIAGAIQTSSFRRLVAGAALTVVMAASAALTATADPSRPAATVERLHAALIEVMKNADTLGFEGRRQSLEPVLIESFDLGYISEIVLGREWDGLSEQDRARMIDTFTRLTVATYAARFDGYSGESFRTAEEKAMNRGRVLVRTELVRTDDEPVQLDYVLQQQEGSWRIVNVVAEGVSDLSLKRADYGSVIKREGFRPLIDKLESQIVELRGGV